MAKGLKQGTILVVDDDTMIIDLLLSSLEDQCYNTVVATSGEMALSRAEQTAADLILLDVVMSGIDGFETCRRLKASMSTSEIPVIFMSAMTDSENIIAGFKSGAADYVTKPIHIPELLARIETQMALRRMQATLQLQNRRLQQEVKKRQRMENQIRSLNQELFRAQERERKKIAHELHENVAQGLAALKLNAVDMFEHPPTVSAERREKNAMFSRLLDTIIGHIRSMTYQLHPPLLERYGLVRSVSEYCGELSNKHTLQIDFIHSGMNDRRFAMDTEINLYRIIQEGLDNVVKHAEANWARVQLKFNDSRILLTIEDDGRGFRSNCRTASASLDNHMGLGRMLERATLLGGRMQVDARPSGGTRIDVEVPVNTQPCKR